MNNKLDICPLKRINAFHTGKQNDVKFQTLEEYLILAKKLLVVNGNRINSGLAREMLGNDDVIANLATELMSAELSFNGNGNLYGYRKQIAKWVIFEYIERKTKSNKYSYLSIDSEYGDGNHSASYPLSFKNLLKSSEKSPFENACDSENNFENSIQKMIVKGYISNIQGNYLKSHFLDGLSMTEIAKDRGVTLQAVSLSIKRAIKKLRENTGWIEITSFAGYNK